MASQHLFPFWDSCSLWDITPSNSKWSRAVVNLVPDSYHRGQGLGSLLLQPQHSGNPGGGLASRTPRALISVTVPWSPCSECFQDTAGSAGRPPQCRRDCRVPRPSHRVGMHCDGSQSIPVLFEGPWVASVVDNQVCPADAFSKVICPEAEADLRPEPPLYLMQGHCYGLDCDPPKFMC